nr:MAPEG family protein [Acanthopleuribacter pedis]
MPYIFTAIAKIGAPGFSNRRVRECQDKLEGWRKRAHWAHQNGHEAFPPFAAGVIIAHLVGAKQQTIDILAVTFVVFRIVYGICYLTDKPTLRSLAWAVPFISMIALFFIG